MAHPVLMHTLTKEEHSYFSFATKGLQLRTPTFYEGAVPWYGELRQCALIVCLCGHNLYTPCHGGMPAIVPCVPSQTPYCYPPLFYYPTPPPHPSHLSTHTPYIGHKDTRAQ